MSARSAFVFGRFCYRRSPTNNLFAFLRTQRSFSRWSQKYSLKDPRQRWKHPGVFVTFAAISPAAFIRASEEENGDGKTAEEHMLEMSREEIRKKVPEDSHGISRVGRTVWFLLDQYIYEPICTTLRFLHLGHYICPSDRHNSCHLARSKTER